MARKKQKASDWSDKNRRILVPYDESHINALDPAEVKDEDRIIYNFLLLYPEHGEYFPKSYPRTDHCSQDEFGRLFNISQSRVSQLLARRVLTPAMPWRIWAVEYFSYLKGCAAGARGSALLW